MDLSTMRRSVAARSRSIRTRCAPSSRRDARRPETRGACCCYGMRSHVGMSFVPLDEPLRTDRIDSERLPWRASPAVSTGRRSRVVVRAHLPRPPRSLAKDEQGRILPGPRCRRALLPRTGSAADTGRTGGDESRLPATASASPRVEPSDALSAIVVPARMESIHGCYLIQPRVDALPTSSRDRPCAAIRRGRRLSSLRVLQYRR